jgi:hypothetical protein
MLSETSAAPDIASMVMSALLGGLVTALTALPFFYNRLTKVSTEVDIMRTGCATCKSSVEKNIEKLVESVNTHHSNDERHNSGSSQVLLADILTRVMRIESRLLTGHQKEA